MRRAELRAAIGRAISDHSSGRSDAQHPPVPTERNGKKQAGSGAHILLAEDNAVNQRLARVLLEKAGHSVVVANTGQNAVRLWAEQPFDLILMDVQMPDMDGLEATAAIRRREQPSGTHIPIVAMTAHAMSGDRQRCLDAGMDDYTSKPIRGPELLELITRYSKTASRV